MYILKVKLMKSSCEENAFPCRDEMCLLKGSSHWKINNLFRKYLAQYMTNVTKLRMQILRVLNASIIDAPIRLFVSAFTRNMQNMVKNLIDHGFLKAKYPFSVLTF